MEEKRFSTQLGRPLKGKSARKSITVLLDSDNLAIIDDFVIHTRNQGDKGYSRSEFVNEAITEHMKKLGLKAE